MSDELARSIEQHVSTEEVVEVCRDLVRAPSENPPGDEREVAEVAERWLGRLGLGTERVEPKPGRVSVLSSWGSGDRTLLFNGHYDVVPVSDPEHWPFPPFGAAVDDGKIFGRGTCDMKAGIASAIAAVATLQRAGIDPDGRLLLHLVADEETLGVWGTRHLVEAGYCDGATEALVGEPTSMNLVTSERGAVWLRIFTEGSSAHGSTPQLGVNAIEHMARVVEAVRGIRFRKLHDVLGAPTVNIGTIRGGHKVNMVPDHCEIEIDRRTLPGESTDEIVAEFEAALDRAREAEPGLRARIEVDDTAEAAETPPETSMVGLLAQGRDAFGVDGSEVGYMGATDARYLINQGHIPSVIFGPGDIMLAHTTGEYVEIDSLVACTKVYAYAFAGYLAGH